MLRDAWPKPGRQETESRLIEGFRANRRLLGVERVSYDGILAGKPFSRSTARSSAPASAPPDSAVQGPRPRAGTRTSGSVSVAKGHGSRLRSGLAAGGKRLRTLGPRYIDDAFETILVAWLAFAFLPEGPTRSQGGTAGSNPLSSSGESDKLAGPDRQLGRLNGIWERQRKHRPYWAPRESRREAPRSKCRA